MPIDRWERGKRTMGGRASNCRGRALLLVLTALLAAFLLAPAAWAALGEYRCTDTGRVYYGNPRLIRTPAVVSADRVYSHIEEYQQILREGLTEQDVRYHFLMKQASNRFTAAVREMARAHGYDFVAEVGCIEVVKEGASAPPDQTDDVINRLASGG